MIKQHEYYKSAWNEIPKTIHQGERVYFHHLGLECNSLKIRGLASSTSAQAKSTARKLTLREADGKSVCTFLMESSSRCRGLALRDRYNTPNLRRTAC